RHGCAFAWRAAEGEMRAPRAGPIAVLAALLACACGSAATPLPSPSVVAGTPTVNAVALQATLDGQPTRTFGSGHWRVCDRGTVTNPSSVVAHDVRVVVTYMVHGTVDGRTTRADATSDGGALGDMPPGASRPFTVCG